MSSSKRETKVPSIPDVIDPANPGVISSILGAVKELLEVREGQRGNPEDRFVKVRDLNNQAFVSSLQTSIGQTGEVSDGETKGGKKGGGNATDSEPPDPPTNLVVTPMGFYNHLTWTNPTNKDLSHIEVWCSADTQSRSAAVLIGVVTAPVAFFDHFFDDPTADYYYWVRAVDFSGNYSTWEPPDTQGGYYVPGDDSYQEFIRRIMDSLIGNIAENHLYKTLNSRIDKIEITESQVGALETLVAEHYAEYLITAAMVTEDHVTVAQTKLLAEANQASITDVVQVQNAQNDQIGSLEQRMLVVDGPGGLTAQYTIKTDVNGYIAGFGLYNTGATSDAIFLVDRFMVVTPGKTPKVPFVVGSVNGVSSVGINGQLVVDGTITALKVGANQINGNHIIGKTINAGHIQAKSITSDLINVGTLQEIAPDLGILVSGKLQADAYHYLNLNATGNQIFVRSGQDSGFYVAADGTMVFGQFSSTVPGRRAITWYNGNLKVWGDIIGTENIIAKGVTNIVSYEYPGILRHPFAGTANYNVYAWTNYTWGPANLAWTTLSDKWAGSTLQIHCEASWGYDPPIDDAEPSAGSITFGLYRGSTLLKQWTVDAHSQAGASLMSRTHWITNDGTSGNITYYLKAIQAVKAAVSYPSITIIEFRR